MMCDTPSKGQILKFFFIGLRKSSMLFGVFKADKLLYLENKVLSSFSVFPDRAMRLADYEDWLSYMPKNSLYQLIQNERKLQS